MERKMRNFQEVKEAAEQGDADAQYNLGLMYDNGEGVEQDKFEAVKWYKKAAEQGHAEAQNNLGIMDRQSQGLAWIGKKFMSLFK
jgi:TPR repeat protein